MSEEIVMCDKVEGERATMRYVWAWGEEGVCSAKGQFLVAQLAKNLKQGVSFVPLANLPPPPLGRDERTQLIAERLSAQAEVKEVTERNSRLYAQNTELGSQVRQLTLRNEQADAEIARLQVDLAGVREAHSRQTVELNRVSADFHRANVLLEAGPQEADREMSALREQLRLSEERYDGLAVEFARERERLELQIAELKSNVVQLRLSEERYDGLAVEFARERERLELQIAELKSNVVE
jgi:chromosome segregation ATPase